MTKLDPGKQAEKDAAAWLEQCSKEDAGFAWHRLPDARSAMGRVAAQPSDFLVSVAVEDGLNRTVYLEVKETANPARLPKAKIGQYGMLQKFYWTNAHVLVLVYMSAHQKWVYMTGAQLFCFEDCPASFLLTRLRRFDTAADALQEYFGGPNLNTSRGI